jgi:hypothetical protein
MRAVPIDPDSGPNGHPSSLVPFELVELARQHLGTEDSVYFAPAIPLGKEANARAVHRAHLPGSEPILVLYDATLFGSAENGFLVTPERLCWKNLLEHPRQVPWGALDPGGVVAEAERIVVAGGGISASGAIIPSTVGLILAMAARYVGADAGPYRSDANASEARVTQIVALARRHLGEVETMYYHPAIPPPKLHNARAVHAARLHADETVAVLYDDTVFGSAKDGFLVTPRRLCIKNFNDDAAAVEWTSIVPELVSSGADLVHLMGWTIQLTAARHHLAPAKVADFLLAVVAEARRHDGGAPHTPGPFRDP